jgi:hypothetical protein
MFLYRIKQFLAGCHVAAADENGGIFFVFGGAGKNAAIYQITYIIRRQSAMTDDMIRATVVSHNGVKNGRVGVGIELKQ